MKKFFGLLGMTLLVSVMAMAFVACGDDDDSDDSGGSGGSSAGSPAASGGAVTPANFSKLKSYEFDMTLTGVSADFVPSAQGAAPPEKVEMSGAFIAPDKMRFTMKLRGEELAVVVIGKDQWVKLGGSWVGPQPGGQAESVIGDLGDGIASSNVKCENAKPEKVNGVDALRCSLSQGDIEKIAKSANPGSATDVSDTKVNLWIAKDGGYPVKLEFTAKDKKTSKDIGVKFELKNVNGNVKIDAPK